MQELKRYICVGMLNVTIDIVFLNALIKLFGLFFWWHYPLYKSFSFLISVTHSYFWNRYWVFRQSEADKYAILKFFVISVVSLFLNVMISTLSYHFISGVLNNVLSANTSAILGAGVAFLSNFLGYRIFIFTRILQ